MGICCGGDGLASVWESMLAEMEGGALLARNNAKCEKLQDSGATYHHMRPSLRLVRLLLQLERTQRKH